MKILYIPCLSNPSEYNGLPIALVSITQLRWEKSALRKVSEIGGARLTATMLLLSNMRRLLIRGESSLYFSSIKAFRVWLDNIPPL